MRTFLIVMACVVWYLIGLRAIWRDIEDLWQSNYRGSAAVGALVAVTGPIGLFVNKIFEGHWLGTKR